MLEYNWTRLLNKYMYAATIYIFFSFQFLKNYTSTIYLQKTSSRRWWLLGLGLVKNLTFSYKRADFSVTVNISVKTLWCHAIDTIFAFFYIFHFFQTIMVSLFLACHDQYFMFRDSNVFEFTNFPLKTKYNIIL